MLGCLFYFIMIRNLFLLILMLFLTCSIVYAEEDSEKTNWEKFIDALVEHEKQKMKKVLKSWVDKEAIKYYYQKNLTEGYIKKLYKEFKETIVAPPNPDTYTEYTIPNVKESLVKVEKLAKKMQNLFLAVRYKKNTRYGKLIWLMRDVLYLDWQHIPYAIKHNNGRDIYWYELHYISLNEAENEYLRLFFCSEHECKVS